MMELTQRIARIFFRSFLIAATIFMWNPKAIWALPFGVLIGILTEAVSFSKKTEPQLVQDLAIKTNITLREFITLYVRPNTMIRLWYKGQGSGFEQVIGFDKPFMEHELVKNEYSNKKVIGVKDILYQGSPYSEAVNIVIERD